MHFRVRGKAGKLYACPENMDSFEKTLNIYVLFSSKGKNYKLGRGTNNNCS
jgi:hypothetical protein